MVKRTYNNFLRAMEILQNQAYMTPGRAEQKTREIFDAVEYDRKAGRHSWPGFLYLYPFRQSA